MSDFIDEIRKQLIESGEASKDLLDYIDERIRKEVGNRIADHLAALAKEAPNES